MKQRTHQEEAEFKYLWMDAQTRGNWEGTKQAQAATSRLEGVGNTTGGVKTLLSTRSSTTAYGGEVEGREVDTKSECGAEWRVSAVTEEGAEQGGSDAGGDWGGARLRRTGGDPAKGDRAKAGGSTVRADSPGVWGLGGGRNYHSTLPHIKLIKLII